VHKHGETFITTATVRNEEWKSILRDVAFCVPDFIKQQGCSHKRNKNSGGTGDGRSS
jgi:hypothetical protein